MKYQVLNHIFQGIEIFSKLEDQDFLTHLKDFLEEYEINGLQADIISKIEDEDDKQEMLEFFRNFKEVLSKAASKSEVLHFMADNFSASLKPEIGSQDEKQLQEKLSLEARRANFLALFLQIPEEKLQETQNGKTILHRIIGAPIAFGRELTLEVIARSGDLSRYSTKSPNSSASQDFSLLQDEQQSLLEYFIAQAGFGEETKFVSEIAIALLEKGCKFEFEHSTNPDNLNNLLHSRSIKSGLAQNLCLYFITKHQDSSLFFEVLRYYDAVERQSLDQSRRDSRSSSRASSSFQGVFGGYAALRKDLLTACQRVISETVANGAINIGKDPKKQETIPAFLLRKTEKNEENNLIQSLWTYLQRRDNILQLKPELFLQQDYLGFSFLHRIVDSRNAQLLSFAIAKIQESQYQSQVTEILNLRNNSGRNAFHLACINGFDNAILTLAPISEVNEVDSNGRTPLMDAVANGKMVSVRKLLEIPEIDIEAQKSLRRPIFSAVKNNQESIAVFLLENGANPNAISIVVDDEGEKHDVLPIQQAIENQNFELVQSLVKYGATIRDEMGNYLRHFQEYFETLSQEQKSEIAKAEKYAMINESLKNPVLRLIANPQENSVDAEMLRRMQDLAQKNRFDKAFEFYHQKLEEKRDALTPSPTFTALSASVSRVSSTDSKHH